MAKQRDCSVHVLRRGVTNAQVYSITFNAVECIISGCTIGKMNTCVHKVLCELFYGGNFHTVRHLGTGKTPENKIPVKLSSVDTIGC